MTRLLGGIARDVHGAVRSLTAARWYSLTVVLFLTLGIGANTAVFGLVNGLLFRQPAVHEPERLVSVWQQSPDAEADSGLSPLSWPALLRLRERTTTLVAVAGQAPGFLLEATIGDLTEPNQVAFVDGAFFDVLGLHPAAGRFFAAVETAPPNEHDVVVISHALWIERFGRGQEVVGSTVNIKGDAYRVVGVAPEGFRGTFMDWPPTDVWLPMPLIGRFAPNWGAVWGNMFESEDLDWIYSIGRIAPGLELAAVRAELGAIRESEQDGRLRPAKSLTASMEIRRHPREGAELRAWALFASAVSLALLAIVCANVAALRLAESLKREREFAIRLALGCSSWRIGRQLFAEGLLLAGLASASALAISIWGKALIVRMAPYWPAWLSGEDTLDAGPDLSVLLFVAVTGILVAAVTTIGATGRGLQRDPSRALRGVGGAEPQSLGLRALVIVQLALSMTLLMTGGLLVRSYYQVESADPGFDANRLLLVQVHSFEPLDDEEASAKYATVVTELQATAGVAAVSYATQGPGGAGLGSVPVRLVPADGRPGSSEIGSMLHLAGPVYFRAAGVDLLAGSDLGTGQENPSRFDVVVNETLARRMAPGGEILGRELVIERHPYFKGPPLSAVVVGVARDTINVLAGLPTEPTIWLPFDTHPGALAALATFLHVRTRESPDSFALAVRERVAQAGGFEVTDVLTGRAWHTWFYARLERFAVFAAVLATTALVLATLGTYAALSHAWLRRRREIGIRIAVGATRKRILRLVLADAMRMALGATPLGLLLFAAITPWMTAGLNGVPAYDVGSLAAALVLTLVATTAAALSPAWRAADRDPIEVIRES